MRECFFSCVFNIASRDVCTATMQSGRCRENSSTLYSLRNAEIQNRRRPEIQILPDGLRWWNAAHRRCCSWDGSTWHARASRKRPVNVPFRERSWEQDRCRVGRITNWNVGRETRVVSSLMGLVHFWRRFRFGQLHLRGERKIALKKIWFWFRNKQDIPTGNGGKQIITTPKFINWK